MGARPKKTFYFSCRFLHSTAAVPITTRLSGTWHVKVDKGSKKVLGHYIPALQITVRCESRSINSEGDQLPVAFAQILFVKYMLALQ